MTNGVATNVIAGQLGKLKVSILDNLPVGDVQTALDNTSKTLPRAIEQIKDTVEIAVTRNLDAPSGQSQALAVVSNQVSPRTGEAVASFSRSLSIGSLQEMLEGLIRQAVQHFPK